MAIAILSIKGIGPAAAATLATHGFNTAEELAAATTEQLSKVPGFSAARAERTLADAAAALAPADPTAANGDIAAEEKSAQADSAGKKDKGKSNKKDKKKHKKKNKNKKSGKKKDKKKGKK
jgi:NAD-dependent DNA ligase